jgi:hypothetical protein
MTEHLTETHARVIELMRKIEERGHRLYMDKFFSSPELFDHLIKKKIKCCETVRLKRKSMPENLRHKTVKVRWGGGI